MPKDYQSKDTENPRRISNSVISLTQFAHSKSKGTRRAIEQYKQKKQSNFNRKAGMLREYKKVMKSEKFTPGRGASRNRSLNDDRNDNNFDEGNNRSKRRHKSDPFAKAKLKAEENKQAIVNKKLELGEKIKQNSINEKKKKLKARKLGKRTRKGQPIMKNVIGDMLAKIKSDEGN